MFESKEKLNGAVDKNIYRGGRSWARAKLDTNKTYKDVGRDELLKIYRKLKPLTKEAVAAIAHILDDGSEAAKMRAAAFILTESKNLLAEIYDSEELVDPNAETNESAAVFHLQVVDKNKRPPE